MKKPVMIELTFYYLRRFGVLRRPVYPVSRTDDTGEGLVARKLSVSPVQQRARAAGMKNAARLAAKAGIAPHTAYRWWRDDPDLLCYDRDILLKLCATLNCLPGDLIVVTEVDEIP